MPTRDINAAFSAGISKHLQIEMKEKPPTYRRIFQEDTSDAKFVDMQLWEGYELPVRKSPAMPGFLGGAKESFSKRFIHDTYYLGDVIPDEDWEDDKYGVLHRILPAKGGMMGRAFRALKEVQHANFFINYGYVSGTSVAGMSDGLSLFNTAHPLSANNTTTFANRPSTDVDLSISSAQTAAINLRTQKSASGNIYLENEVACVVINPALHYVANQIYKGQWERGTADRNENFLRRDNVDIIEWAYFTASGATGSNNSWFVLGEDNYLFSFDRAAYKVESDHDIYVLATIFAASTRFSFGAADWRGVYGSKGA